MDIKKLNEKIETVRRLMLQTAKEKGLNHPETVKISQYLDRLLVLYKEKAKVIKLQNKESVKIDRESPQ